MIYRKFKIDRKFFDNCSLEDKKILNILEKVVKDMALVYDLQRKEGFYPPGITKKDLEKAGKKDPEILSPFTYISKKNDQLNPIPYHERYAKYLQPIAEDLEKAASLSTNKSFKLYLKARAKSLLDGSYREADIAWLNVKNSKIDFSIGPFERYLDKILFIKRTFQAHVGIIDKQYTKLAEQYKEVLYSSAKNSPSKYHSTDIPKKGVSIFVEVTPLISGYPADVLFSGEHFPSDLDIALKYGSRTIIYASQLTLKFEKLYYPIFKIIFEKRFASKYSKELLMEATNLSIFLYELGKQLHNFEGGRGRLQELYGPIDEANGFASGIEHSKHLVVKGLLSQDELEAIIIAHILWMLADWLFYQENKAKESHIIGSSILLNSYLSHGALKESEGISWPNFSRIFFEIETIAYKLVYLLQQGSYKEASKFLKKNVDLGSFERLAKTLGKINTKL